ncbi:uncharacterized protein LOC131945184 isoform X2 [Physella acuta]|uniref:uncharacterized protein LOC131945184 isoform X2 n=1 Tax=Physella acuta TaxID=109671 RepID=UPI0027DE8509|nr:uncharacterized protein LOC131945184 isoform X2 [Physella acuta]
MLKRKKEKNRSAYSKMLGNIASDLDSLLTDLCHKEKTSKGDNSGTLHSSDTLGKDSFFSSAGNTSRRQDDVVSSNHSLVSLSDNERNDCESVDSGHDGRCRIGPSPLVFNSNHFSTQPHQCSSPLTVRVELTPSMDEMRPISTLERLIKTNSIWLLATLSRAGAVHLLKDRDTGNFIVRKSSQNNSLALSVQSRLSGHPVVDHYLIEGSSNGFKLQGSSHYFHSIPALIAYYVENIDEIPYHLCLPRAIQQAKSTRELASIDMLGQDFWLSPLSRKSPSPEPLVGLLHKSSSEPINIQRPAVPQDNSASQVTQNTVPSRSATDFSHFMKNQLEMERYFQQHIHDPQSPKLQNGASTPVKNLEHKQSESVLTVDKPIPGELQKYVLNNEKTQRPLPVLLNQDLTQHNLHRHRLASDESWVLASSPATFKQPVKPASQDEDIYRSNPTNQPADQQHVIHLTQLHFTHASQGATSLPSEHQHSSPGDRSWTPPRTTPPKSKTNLYFTTNLGLLEIPENSYYTSNLSDKLSDYEDIWRTSCCESDADKNNTKMIHDPRAVLDSKINGHGKKTNTKEMKKKVLRKTPKDSPPTRRLLPAGRDSVTGGTTGLTALEQARMIAGSVSEDEAPLTSGNFAGRGDNAPNQENTAPSIPPVPEVFVSEKQIDISKHCTQHKYITSHSLDLGQLATAADSNRSYQAATCVALKESSTFTTTMSVIMSDPAMGDICSENNNKVLQQLNFKKPMLSPLGRLSRLKSSSESSLATASSPLYAEPADAVKLRDKHGKAINIQVRRLSAPLAANQILDKQGKSQHKVSKNPQLDTILSPDAQPSSVTQTKFSFDTSNLKNLVPSAPAPVSKLSRSYSMRTHQEMSQLQRKQSWKDRLNRLKLGTKVLTQNLTQSNTVSVKTSIATHGHVVLDSVLFKEDAGVPMATSTLNSGHPGKFPVESCQEVIRSSCFSESSTVQDLITCAYPELLIKPVAVNFLKPVEQGTSAPPSEYDNMQVYRASTHSSLGTVYSPPWETGTANKFIREPPATVLPPAMDFHERIHRWQMANSNYHDTGAVHINTSTTSSTALVSHQSQDHHIHQQQLQLLQHQQQLKTEDKAKSSLTKSVEVHRQMSAESHQSHKRVQQTDSSSQTHQQTSLAGHSGHNLTRHDSNKRIQESPVSHQLSSLTITSANFADISSSAHTSPHRLSSHCPDVVNCHSSPLQQSYSSTGSEVKLSETTGHFAGEDDVLFGGELAYASEDLKQRLRPVISPQVSISHSDGKSPGAKIKDYIFKLSGDRQTIFGSTIENFIQCTLESQETNPQYVMRNVRQFMTGIKNYLVKHGEGKLEDLIERERNKLNPNEILNIDAIIEQALHVCVLRPLKYHVYRLFVDKYSKNGALEQLSRNIKYARTKSAQDIGVKPGLKLPQSTDMDVIKHYLDLMQKSYSPLQKLQNLLKATSTIHHCVQGKHHQVSSRAPSSLGADDFLPILIYVIVHCGLVSAEIEADFMWGLLQPSLLTGEGGYYLTTLSSAVLILKNFQDTHQLVPAQMEGRLPTISDMQGFLRIAIPDELHGSITWKTLPVRPNMNTRDVCAMVAHKFKVTNPQDYGLYLLCDGQEFHLADTDCPQIIKGDNLAVGKTCCFAFKRIDANIAWPKNMKHSSSYVTDSF